MPADTAMKITALARRAGTSRSTVHYYLGLGLLPKPRVLGPKLHLYGPEHLTRLAQIRELRGRGVALSQIRARLATGHPTTGGATDAHGDGIEAPGSRQVILERATEQFIHRGYDAVRMADLAADLHLSKATLYQHFDGKQGLFVECIERMRHRIFPPRLREQESKLRGPGRRGYLRARAVLQNFEAYRAMVSLLHSVVSQSDRALSEKAAHELHKIATDSVPALEQAIASGVVRKLDAEAVSYMLFGALMWLGDRVQRDANFDIDAALSVYWDVMGRGIARLDDAPQAS